MATLTAASRQWASRPDDERYLNLPDMHSHFASIYSESSQHVMPTRKLMAVPSEDNTGLGVVTGSGQCYFPTHWGFAQLADRAEGPARYLRTLPAPMAADCINYGLQFKRRPEDVGILLRSNGEQTLRSVTGPAYGRIWNVDVVSSLIERFGDGVNGDFRVPGEFGQAVDVDRANTTLYASDRDMFVFLADEEHRIEVPNRRDGKSGSLARGFFLWNSEVGASTLGVSTFLFDYACSNRTVWGAQDVKQFTIRHTASAPDKFVEEMAPALLSYANSSSASVVDAVAKAQAARIADDGNEVNAWLAKRFNKSLAESMQAAHMADEGRPIQTLWDASVGLTAHARSIGWQDKRVDLERKAGALIDLAR